MSIAYNVNFVVYKGDGFGYMATVREQCAKSMEEARREIQRTFSYLMNGDVSRFALSASQILFIPLVLLGCLFPL